MTQPRAAAVPVPATPLLENALPHVDWADAYAVRRPAGSSGDPQVWADAVFHAPPLWIGALMAARESLVRLVGIDRARGSAFDPVARTDDEVLLGIDQSHLGFRASVLCEPDRVVVSTVVRLHNRRGRALLGDRAPGAPRGRTRDVATSCRTRTGGRGGSRSLKGTACGRLNPCLS